MFKAQGGQIGSPQADPEVGRVGMEAVMWEVHVLRQLRGHPNIVKLCDVMELADAVVYVVMERIEGPDLADYIRMQPQGKVPEVTARTFFRHILAGLRHAHARGYLHTDVKPENVRLQVGGHEGSAMTAVLVDWGLARQIDHQSSTITMGTALYASPEQLTGYNADHAWGRTKLGPAADIWALGATLYEILVGWPPFDAPSREELVANALALNYRLDDVLSVGARQLIDSMLQVLPSDRASVSELVHDPWTTVEGEMPAEVDSVLVDLEETPASPKADASNLRRIALYIAYALLVGGALMFGASHEMDADSGPALQAASSTSRGVADGV